MEFDGLGFCARFRRVSGESNPLFSCMLQGCISATLKTIYLKMVDSRQRLYPHSKDENTKVKGLVQGYPAR